jgi:hypothetical protein
MGTMGTSGRQLFENPFLRAYARVNVMRTGALRCPTARLQRGNKAGTMGGHLPIGTL